MACCKVEDAMSSEIEEQNTEEKAILHQQVFQGYDYDFVPPLDSKYECAICLMCQKDPVQTSCGHRFCRQCILTWIRNESSRCPQDNCPLTEQEVFPDNFAKREITSLHVKCPNFKHGCKAVIELGTIDV